MAFSDAPKCQASKKNGDPCTRVAVKGATVCNTHGGAAPHVRKAAQRRLAAAEATRKLEADRDAILAQEGLQGVEDPLDALSQLATESIALQQAAGRRVNALSKITTTDDFGKKQLEETVALYERAMDRSGRFLDMLVRHGFTEREVKLREQQAAIMLGIIRRTIDSLGLTPEQMSQAQKTMAQEFRDLDILGEDL